MRTFVWVASLVGILLAGTFPMMAYAQDDNSGGDGGGGGGKKLTVQQRAKIKARKKRRMNRRETRRVFRQEADKGEASVPFEAQTPKDMQRIFRSPPRPKKRPQFFNYTQVCGKYDTAAHQAFVCVLEDGRVFGGLPKNIDENDKITVYLIVRKWVSPFYRVQMKPVQLFTRGNASAVIPDDMIKKPEKPVFIVRKYDFGPFRSGNVVLSVSRPSIGKQGVGFVDVRYLVRINPLVPFNIAVAFIGITPINPAYKLIQERGSSITRIARSNEGPVALDLILVAKIYAWQFWDPKLFAGRDVLKPPLFVQRININIGLSFKDLLTSFFVGIGFEVSAGFDLVVGANLRVVDELAGGFQEGNPFAGDVSEIPTVKRFRVSAYFGVSIAPEIFQALFSTLTNGSLFGK